MKTIFNCKLETDNGEECWTGTVTKIINHGSHYEIKIESRSSMNVIIGSTEQGNFACVPDWAAGCHLSNFKDNFWNKERLCRILGNIDGITVADALYTIADYL
jgi:hypothetical protein